MTDALTIACGALTFLVAAKAHGRQLRLERELAGCWQVTFRRGSQNPPFVTALWRRERVIFWPATIASAVLLVLFAPGLSWPLAYVLLPMTIGFAIGGVLSLLRLLRAIPAMQADANRPADWLHAALRGSIAWWLAALVLAVATSVAIVHGVS